jgi:uncharacterized membrane protein YfcA
VLWAWILVSFAVFLIGITKSGLGAGMGLIVVPLTAIGLDHTSMGSSAALGLLLPLLITGDAMSIGQYRKLVDFKLIRPLLMPTAVGILLGSVLLYIIHGLEDQKLVATLIRLEIGLESVILVGIHWYRTSRSENPRLMPEPLRSWISGSFAGVSTTLAHAAGPVVSLYLLPLKPTRQAFVASTAVFFGAVNLVKLPAYFGSGMFQSLDWLMVLIFMPLVILGAVVGFRLNKRMSDAGFAKFAYAATFAIGLYLVAESVVRLAR